MHIEHLAIWAHDLEKMRRFYMDFLGLSSNEKYVNEKKQFSSYFLSFDTGARLELMQRPDIDEFVRPANSKLGLVHFAISVGSEAKVNEMTDQVHEFGGKVVGPPRTTGDGYYESVVADPEGNLIELTV